MTKHISDSERLTIAALNRRETELQEAKNIIKRYEQELKAYKVYIGELKDSNKILSNQVRYLVGKIA